MSAGGGRRPGYLRPMAGWWRRDRYFVRYMAREMTALAVLGYALILLVGLWRLSQGEAAWNGWLAALRSPAALLAHAVILAAMLVHAKSWFEIMPKTLPALHIGARRLEARTITRAGWVAVAACTIVVWVLAWLPAAGSAP